MTQSSSSRRALVVRNASHDLSPFASKLVQLGYIDSEKMQQAALESRKTGKPLTQILESLTGKALSPELQRQYKKNQLFELKIIYGVESLDPEIKQIEQSQVSELIDTLIPIDSCRRSRFVPLSKEATEPPSVLVAMVNPDDLDAQDDLNRILRPQGINWQRMVITAEDYSSIINQYLDQQAKKDEAAKAQKSFDVQGEIQNLEGLEAEDSHDIPDEDLTAAAEDAPIITLVNKILAKALTDEVSDIHVEPQEEYLRIRFRKDGVLREAFDPLPKKIIPAVTSRFKIIAQLDIAERRAPQDGRIRRVFQGRKVDFRVNTLPSRYGEKICMRILDNSSTQLGLDKLISDPDALQSVRDMASRPFGMILVTGPTGSGKSTTLYSILAERNSPDVNISTAEDPIEYALPGINQVQVIREKGMNFAAILRAFMRQDPDVILVGETRDVETAKTAIEAALTGHLVMTTLHANDASSSIARLDEMGVEPFMVAASLLGVCAQRLMRRVCTECRIPYQPTIEELNRYGLSASKEGSVTFYKANSLQPEEIKTATNLCPKCKGLGYKGRVGVYEVMRITERLQSLINKGGTTDMIKEAAVEDGMVTLLSYSLNLVREGHTTLEEVERVTFTDTGLESELKAKRKTTLTCRICSAGLKQEWLDCPYCMTSRFEE
ncbi:type II secretion system protein E [Crinalium epipsammum PCC 9333]|uniref:Type II secretion system protein E n=1 Tax=Crinalium epipsammum PCC 9333 TaxID=1173022 RepID=K9W4C5_9CYAN|nr:GspE/PulE family protein [Crinalium epipsammum]AFZ14649.1 type II secretion system protein E [Crinalium epipsammum PCC 9333]